MSQCSYRTCSTAGDGRKALTQELQLGRKSLSRCVCVCRRLGGTGRVHFLMLGCSTLSHQVTAGHPSLHATYKHHETLKRRCYEQCIRETEHGCSHHLSSRPHDAWHLLLPSSIKGSPRTPGRETVTELQQNIQLAPLLHQLFSCKI